MDVWYHVAHRHLAKRIAKFGLSKGTVGNNPVQSGDGVYFFRSDLGDLDSIASDLAEHLGFDDAVLVAVDLAGKPLLMDEDSLFIEDEDELERLYAIMPPDAVAEYAQYLADRGGEDELPVNDGEVAAFKVGLIDRHRIRPSPKFPNGLFRYAIETCRTTAGPLIPLSINPLHD